MKILWVKADFLHPTNRGGQIRTLGILQRLHRRHEIHYAAMDDGRHPEGFARAREYSTEAYAVPNFVPEKTSLAFAGQLAAGLVSELPVAVARYRSAKHRRLIEGLLEKHRFDSVVCDFLFPAPNIPDLASAVLFEHNVETMIWRRHVEHARDPLRRLYLRLQARKMEAFERQSCRRAGHVITVSETDSEIMRRIFGDVRVSEIPTGVDLEYFAPAPSAPSADLVFVGSMDWMPNIDGAEWFVSEILPRIRRRRPETTVAIVGRRPVKSIRDLAARTPGLAITGTVPDVRPYLWGAKASVVPLRIGGGTRLKIYESMAAMLPVVSTTVGAEGLPLTPGEHLEIADQPEEFAEKCVALLGDEARRRRMAAEARDFVAARFSWDSVAAVVERILAAGPRP